MIQLGRRSFRSLQRVNVSQKKSKRPAGHTAEVS